MNTTFTLKGNSFSHIHLRTWSNDNVVSAIQNINITAEGKLFQLLQEGGIFTVQSATLNGGSTMATNYKNAADSILINNGVYGNGSIMHMTGILYLNNQSGNSSYSGGTSINGGTVYFNNGGLGTGRVTLGPNNGYSGNGTLAWNTGNTQDISSNGIFVDTGGGTLNVGANNVTLAGANAITGTGNLTKKGTGNLVLGSSNSFNGNLTIAQGTLHLNGGQRSLKSANRQRRHDGQHCF